MPARAGNHPRIAIVGATGTVGSQIAALIEERAFPHAELKLFGSNAEVSAAVEISDEVREVDALESASELAAFDIAFIATPAEAAEPILRAAPGPFLIDLSGAKLTPDGVIPIVAPGLTPRSRLSGPQDLRCFTVPHPAAQVIANLMSALDFDGDFAAAMVLLAAASRGREAIAALFRQSADLLNLRLDLADEETQTAFNVFLPRSADATAATIAAQVAILRAGAPAPLVQIAHVPAFHGGAVALLLPANPAIAEWGTRLREAPGIVLVESGAGSSFVAAATQDAVVVKLTATAAGATLWCVFDPARVAALTALWIAENLDR